jgi:HlyD family secretion protein
LQTVYLLQKQEVAEKGSPSLKAVQVKAGITDGSNTEIIEGLKEGDEVVVGAIRPDGAAPTTRPAGTSPFGGFPRRF